MAVSGGMSAAFSLQVKGDRLTERYLSAYPRKDCKHPREAVGLLAEGMQVTVTAGDIHETRRMWSERVEE